MRLSGYALHAGTVTSVELRRHQGPITLAQRGFRAPLSELRVLRADHGVTVGHGSGLQVDLVEHLLAAVGGLAIASGLLIDVEGAEVPLLDGGSRLFAHALTELDIPPAPRALRITRDATLSHAESVYHFAPGNDVQMIAHVAFAHPGIGKQEARWDGSSRAFLSNIAPARTFGFRADVNALWGRGRARLAAIPAGLAALERAVQIFDDHSPPAAGCARSNEVARHKLLDLIGDFTLHGGPPLGRVTAERPGHRATHDVVARALALGVLAWS